MKSNSIFSLSNNENAIFEYSLVGTTFFSPILFLMNPVPQTSLKGLRRRIFVRNYVKRLAFRSRTVDVTNCAHVTLFCTRRQADYHVHWNFFCVDFFRPWAGHRHPYPPPPLRGNFVHYNFLKLHYIRNKMTHVSPLAMGRLRVTAMLPTLPSKQ